ncbi:MAG: nitrogen fixation protein NifH, partial [Candidatus Thorarchaeota archaeon]
MFEVEQKTINWLLENNNPPVKYLTQIKILDIDGQDNDVISSKEQIMSYRPIKEILDNQIKNRYWFDAKKDQNYKKYLGTYWQLIFLYELNALTNTQIENAIEHIFSTGQAPNGG